MKDSVKKFLHTNCLILVYLALAFLIDLTGVCVTSGKFYIRNPLMFLTVIGALAAAAAFITSQKARFVFLSVVLTVLYLMDAVFIVIYDMTGTMFEFSMLSLKHDAMNIVESVPINFAFSFVSIGLLTGWFIFGTYVHKKLPAPAKGRGRLVAQSAVMAVVLLVHGLTIGFTDFAKARALVDKIYESSENAYVDYGIIGNFTTEMYGGLLASRTTPLDDAEIDGLTDFIYAETSPETEYTGLAEGYNVVTVLCESFEWFSFMADLATYPNGFGCTEETLRALYPNLYEFHDNSVVATNFHALEKTDISENLSIIGNYPLESFINYAYPENTLPYSLPNVLKNLYGVSSNSFHDGTNTFYNRNVHHVNALGFDSFTSSEMMGFDTDDPGHLGEANRDSEMIRSCADEMFPTDRRFHTYITTISMHGQYAYRENFSQYYDKLDEYGLMPLHDGLDAESQAANALRYYCAAAMELDAAVGEIMNELRTRTTADGTPLIENTLVVLFGDHYSYYQQVTNYAKNIYNSKADNYTELYRIPLMIRIGDMEGQTRIDKFACTADILPTILDLLGIRYYSNIYYGHSLFDTEESILYSRAYDKFITDKVVFMSINKPIYTAPDVDEVYMADIEQRARTIMTKTEYVMKIFKHDFFAGEAGEQFNRNMRELNGVETETTA